MTEMLSIDDLSAQLNAWCDDHGVVPASGQAGERMTERSIRYYRSLGLVDAPEGGAYGEKHLLQLMAARLLQAQGLPLRRIRELLFGRSVAELRVIRDRGLAETGIAESQRRINLPVADELWRMIPLDEDFLLVSRRGTSVTPAQQDAVRAALQTHSPVISTPNHHTR